jgi:hypothetical protein
MGLRAAHPGSLPISSVSRRNLDRLVARIEAAHDEVWSPSTRAAEGGAASDGGGDDGRPPHPGIDGIHPGSSPRTINPKGRNSS